MVKRSVASLCLLLLAVAWRQTQAQLDTSHGHNVPLRNVLATAQSLSFTAKLTYGSYGEPENARKSGQTFLVKARKPDCLRIDDRLEDIRHPKTSRLIFTPYDTLITNGKSQIDQNITSKKYTLRPPPRSLAEVSSEGGIDSLVCCHLLFVPDMLRATSAKYDGKEEIEGQKVAVYRAPPPQIGHAQYVLYLDPESGLPHRISLFDKDADGHIFEWERTDFSDWQLNPTLPDALFDTTPPADFHLQEPEQPAYNPKWKAGMIPAPLRASTLAEKPLTLDAYKGKVLLLDYWASWCGPCLSEVPDMLAMYLQWHKQGLDIIGISLDGADQRAQLKKYLQQKQLSWPQVCDYKGFNSPFATAYQLNAIPFNVLIGRDGKIAGINLHGRELKQTIQKALTSK